MPWVRRILRGNTVFVRAGADGALATDKDGRVDVTYKYDGSAKIYRASAKNLEPGSDAEVLPDLERVEVAPANVEKGAKGEKGEKDQIVVYTDGACSGNPGPMGIGVVVLDNGTRREISAYLGEGTNNIAELTAVERALALMADEARTRPIALHTDSSYVIGVLAKGFKAKANVALITRLRERVRRFPHLRFVKVEGHAGVPENERCDALAREAIATRASRTT
jgi:ribonuclease HI